MIPNPFTKSGKFSNKRVHLAVGGSIACYKAADLLRLFLKTGIHVSVVLTEGACHFVTPLLFSALGAAPVYDRMFAKDSEVFSHLEPGQMGGVLLAAPATADMLARFAQGRADDLAACQCLAFDGPKLAAPAMNTRMWDNPATQGNIAKLIEYGWQIILPEHGALACGETGRGKLAALQTIFLQTLYALAPKDMTGLNVMVTLGPTREAWDGVRFWSNPSSGRMGAALATAAWLRGANVTAICGPGFEVEMPASINLIYASSAREMLDASQAIWPDMNIGVFCAAVADFRPEAVSEPSRKIKKADLPDNFSISFMRNPDILATLASQKNNCQKILGFAAEIAPEENSLISLAKLKLQNKKADLIAANRVCGAENAFTSENSALTVVDCRGNAAEWPLQSKSDNAWELCSWLLTL